MQIFFTSDLHFGHHNIIEYCNRPFKDVDHMNHMLIHNWNKTVSTEDIVFVLGDVALGDLSKSLPLVAHLNGKKLLVPGNHDRMMTDTKNWNLWEDRYRDAGFSWIYGPTQQFRPQHYGLKGSPLFLSHFPYNTGSPDKWDTSRWIWNPGGRTWLLHGHIHQHGKINRSYRSINVGVDVWGYTPVALETIQEIMK